MSQRDDYEPGVPCWVDILSARARGGDGVLRRAVRLGVRGTGPDGLLRGAAARPRRRRDRRAAGRGPAPPPAWNTYVYVESADETAEKARSAGGAVLIGGLRRASGRSPGHPRRSGGRGVRRMGAPRAQAARSSSTSPAAWAMSHLETPDPDGAAAFYGAVFGWTTETFGEGAGAFTMFRLPGYVGGEPQQPVSREVIATMAALRDERRAALERQLLGPRRRRDRREGRRARRQRRRGALRHADDQDGRARRPARRHVHHQQRPRLTRSLRWPTSPSSTT